MYPLSDTFQQTKLKYRAMKLSTYVNDWAWCSMSHYLSKWVFCTLGTECTLGSTSWRAINKGKTAFK